MQSQRGPDFLATRRRDFFCQTNGHPMSTGSKAKRHQLRRKLMRLNQTVRYGVACLLELSKHLGEYVDTSFIAARQNIPVAYAHKVLQGMAHAGLVFAQKGVGYKLARPLSEITALEVFEALSKDVDPQASNPDVGFRLEQRVNQALKSFTLSELQTIA